MSLLYDNGSTTATVDAQRELRLHRMRQCDVTSPQSHAKSIILLLQRSLAQIGSLYQDLSDRTAEFAMIAAEGGSQLGEKHASARSAHQPTRLEAFRAVSLGRTGGSLFTSEAP